MKPGVYATALSIVVAASSLFVSDATGQQQQPTLNDGQATGQVRYDGHKVVRADVKNEAQLHLMMQISPDMWSHAHGPGELDFRIPPDAMDALNASGIQYEVVIEDVQTAIDASRTVAPGADGWFDDYKTYDQINDYINNTLVPAFPNLIEIIDVGRSIENRTIYGYRITGTGGGTSKPAVLYNGTQHAREWISPMVNVYIIDRLLNTYGSDPVVTDIMDDVEFIIVPVVNPDGYEYSWNSQRLWRKNRRNNGGGTWGVDLNRNWGYEWGGSGSSGNPGSETYRGTAPFSEPETAAMRDLFLANPHVAAHIDWHSYSQLVLQPWAYTTAFPPDHDLFEYLGGWMSDVIFEVHGKTYVHGHGGRLLYLAAGDATDYAYGDQGALSVTIELRDTGQTGFLLPPDQIIPCAEEVFPAALVFPDWVRTELLIGLPNGAPSIVDPDTTTEIEVSIQGVNGFAYEPGTGKLFSRIGSSGPFDESALVPLGGDLFEATLPAVPCGETIQFYFYAEATGGGSWTLPRNAPDETFEAESIGLTPVFTDDFNTNKGWTVESINLTEGEWERAVPSRGGARGDPPSDFDGSGFCYVTDDGNNADVDGGPTVVTSPLIDLTAGDALVTYARWFYNDDSDQDRFTTEVSNDDGGTWTLVDEVGNTSGWQEAEFRVADFVTPTSQMRFRFRTADQPNNSITEAALDAFAVSVIDCGGSGGMQLDVGTLTAGQNGQFDVTNGTPNTMTYLAYSLSGRGSTFVPQLNVTLGLNRPAQAGSGMLSDANGAASWSLLVPPAAAGRTVWVQAAQAGEASNVVEATVN